jgi:E3 ubiquitin-protein ligase BOI-like protein
MQPAAQASVAAAAGPSGGVAVAQQQQQQPQVVPAARRQAFLPPWLLAGARAVAPQQQQPAAAVQSPAPPQQQQQHAAATALPQHVSRVSSSSSPQLSRVSSSNSMDVSVDGAAGSGGLLRRPCRKCGAAESSVLLMPCKHMVLCKACADAQQAAAGQLPASWSKPKCPKSGCQVVIQHYVPVHHS